MPDPTLNERAAKCMRWGYIARFSGGYCAVPGTMRTHDPANSLDDAALVRDRAIEVCGFRAYFDALSDLVGASIQSLAEISTKRLLLATPAQITEAAVLCLEAATPPSP